MCIHVFSIDYDKAGDIYHPSVLSKCHFDGFVKRHLSTCSQLKKVVKAGNDVILFIALKCCCARIVGAIP